MTIGFLNLALLAGLAALAIPPIIHFLNRRRHDVVDWGAMQFLVVSPAKRRRFLIEEFLLMALRMGLIALLVLALAAPHVSGPLVADWARPPRDAVIVIDGSYSMQQTDGKSPSPWEQAKTWCKDWLAQARGGDRLALIVASQPLDVASTLTTDHASALEEIERLPSPTGNADWPRAVAEAWNLLRDDGQAARRDIVLLTDRQKLGWADAATLSQWQPLAHRLQTERESRKGDANFTAPAIWAAQLGGPLAGPSVRLAPLQAPRTTIGLGQRLRFTTALHWDATDTIQPPKSVSVSVGDTTRDLPLPGRLEGKSGRLPLIFEHRFSTLGVQLVRAAVEPAAESDVLPADNTQHLAVEVVQELPVLLIDGDKSISAESATFYLAKAFADPADKARISFIVPNVVAHADFDPEAMLRQAARVPRVVVLGDVPLLTEPQVSGLTRFVEGGGGLLIFLGPRAAGPFYNEHLFRDGKGLLPARLERIETVPSERTTAIDVKRFLHPALTLFRDEPNCSLGQAGYTRWWKAVADKHGQGTPVAQLSNDDPWLIEKTLGQGRVLLSTLPMDRSWDGHLPKTWEFPVLVHELIFALADARTGGFNLSAGQALRVQSDGTENRPASIFLRKQNGEASSRTAAALPYLWTDVGPPGVYHVQVGDGVRRPVVVHADPRESDLTPCTDPERQRVAEVLSLRYLDDARLPDSADLAAETQDVWWLFLFGVMALLCAELWLTRRMALARGPI